MFFYILLSNHGKIIYNIYISKNLFPKQGSVTYVKSLKSLTYEFIVRAGLINCINWKMLELQLIGEASNGQEALQIILQDTPDIILLDLIMPEMTGMELLQKLEDLD